MRFTLLINGLKTRLLRGKGGLEEYIAESRKERDALAKELDEHLESLSRDNMCSIVDKVGKLREKIDDYNREINYSIESMKIIDAIEVKRLGAESEKMREKSALNDLVGKFKENNATTDDLLVAHAKIKKANEKIEYYNNVLKEIGKMSPKDLHNYAWGIKRKVEETENRWNPKTYQTL